jgi:hypothetical protein
MNIDFKHMPLDELLNYLSGYLDMAYENTESEEERQNICEVETELHNRLRYVDLIK